MWLTLVVGFLCIAVTWVKWVPLLCNTVKCMNIDICSNCHTHKENVFSAMLAIPFSDFNCVMSAGSCLSLDMLLFLH